MIEFNIDNTDFSVNIMNLKSKDYVIDISIYIDEIYNLIICKDCGIDISFEYILSYFSGNHGIKVILKQMMMQLNYPLLIPLNTLG